MSFIRQIGSDLLLFTTLQVHIISLRVSIAKGNLYALEI